MLSVPMYEGTRQCAGRENTKLHCSQMIFIPTQLLPKKGQTSSSLLPRLEAQSVAFLLEPSMRMQLPIPMMNQIGEYIPFTSAKPWSIPRLNQESPCVLQLRYLTYSGLPAQSGRIEGHSFHSWQEPNLSTLYRWGSTL